MEEEIEGQRDIALEILIRAGVLKLCPIHEDAILSGGADIEDAYKLGNYLFTNDSDEWELQHVFRDRREMTDTIKEMFEWQLGGADECGWCMKD
ncbi:MAG: hypothetical protein AB1424_11880 [Thermodesulfobacteriota bacterium]